jgi:electron transfer flavoprotein beta subunit
MKLLVLIKRTPHRDARIRVTADGAALELDGVKFEVNPFDELAVEEALRIQEQRGDDVEVVVTTVGDESCHQQLISVLAMGAGRAVRVDTQEDLDSLQVAKALAAIVEREKPDLVLAGKLAVDDESGQVPMMLAGLLGWPQANQASKIELSDDATSARVTCEVDAGLEEVSVPLPAVITADLRLNEPRYASLPGIMKAKKKPFDVVPLADLGDVGVAREKATAYRSLPRKAAGIKVESVDALVEALSEKKLI